MISVHTNYLTQRVKSTEKGHYLRGLVYVDKFIYIYNRMEE